MWALPSWRAHARSAHAGAAPPAGVDPAGAGRPPRARARSALEARAIALELRASSATRCAPPGGASGAYVDDIDAADDRLLYANDGRDKRIPASNQKLFTTAALLDRYGADGSAGDGRSRPRPDGAPPGTRSTAT